MGDSFLSRCTIYKINMNFDNYILMCSFQTDPHKQGKLYVHNGTKYMKIEHTYHFNCFSMLE